MWKSSTTPTTVACVFLNDASWRDLPTGSVHPSRRTADSFNRIATDWLSPVIGPGLIGCAGDQRVFGTVDVSALEQTRSHCVKEILVDHEILLLVRAAGEGGPLQQATTCLCNQYSTTHHFRSFTTKVCGSCFVRF